VASHRNPVLLTGNRCTKHQTESNGGPARLSIFAFAALLGSSLAAPSIGLAGQYEFSLIASTGDTYSSLGNSPSLNDSGAVAFRATLPDGSPVVLKGQGGGNVTTIATLIKDEYYHYPDAGCSINANGQVVFAGLIEPPTSFPTPVTAHILVGDGASITTVHLTGTYGISATVPIASINDHAEVAYDVYAMYLGIQNIETGLLTTIAEGYLGDIPNGIGASGAPPALNNEGTVAFIGFPRFYTSKVGIYTGNGGPATLIAQSKAADPTSPILSLSAPSINDSGLVAFAARLENEEQAIYTSAGGVLVKSIDTSGPYKSLVGNVALNESGELAFAAELDDGSKGIFTGSNPQSQKVIAVGDALLGSTVTDLSFFRDGLNNEGQLAFYAALADGRLVIVRADPLPEAFKSFDAQAVILDFPRAHVQLDAIGSIQLGATSNGVDPLQEDVGISVTNQDGVTWNATLPPGSFSRAGKASVVSRGNKGEMVRFMSITAERREGKYTFALQGVDVDDLADGSTRRVSKNHRGKRTPIPLTISLRIGDDASTTTLHCTAGGQVSVCH